MKDTSVMVRRPKKSHPWVRKPFKKEKRGTGENFGTTQERLHHQSRSRLYIPDEVKNNLS